MKFCRHKMHWKEDVNNFEMEGSDGGARFVNIGVRSRIAKILPLIISTKALYIFNSTRIEL